MRNQIFLTTVFLLIASSSCWAQVKSYEVKSVKSLTPYVDRLFNSQNLSFANIFCQENTAAENAALILVIDGSSIDGQVFNFPSVAICNEARTLITEKHKKCSVTLTLNSQDRSAQVFVGNCL